MVKPITKVEITSFSKGFLTEASPLNFPADATRDEENFELNINGSRDRRLGVDFENNYQLRSTGYNSTDLKGLATSSLDGLVRVTMPAMNSLSSNLGRILISMILAMNQSPEMAIRAQLL